MIHLPQLHLVTDVSKDSKVNGYCFLNWVGEPFYGYDVPNIRGFGPVKEKATLEPLIFEYDEDGNPINEYFNHENETPSHIVEILNPIDKNSFVWYSR